MLRLSSCLILLCAAVSASASLSFVVGHDTDAGLPVLAQTTDQGATWSAQALPASITYAGVYGGDCNSNICVAVGQDETEGNPAMLLQSVNNGSSWDYVTIPGLEKNIPFHRAACSDSICVALGNDEGVPYLAQTKDNGTTWSLVKHKKSADKSVLLDASCHQDTCVIVGVQGKSHLVLQTHDAGGTWSHAYLHGLGAESMLASVDCNAEKCIVGGAKKEGRKDKMKPALYQLTLGKNTWAPVPVVGNLHRNNGFYGNVSCGSVICAATGYSDNKGAHFLAMTDDLGEVWTSHNYIEDTPNIDSSHVRLLCGEKECYILWSTVGSASPASMLIKGSKAKLQALDIPQEATDGKLYDINCGQGLCYVTGSTTDGSPLLIQSMEEGPWTHVNVENAPAKGVFITGASTM